jgi:hypothetical protein
MSTFNLPNGWEVSPAKSWVSHSELSDNGFPALGDPAFCEKADCKCDTESFGDKGMGVRLPNPERENRIITAIDPETKKRVKVTQCPPGFEQADENAPITTCVPSSVEGKAGLKTMAKLGGGMKNLKGLDTVAEKFKSKISSKLNSLK